MVMKKLFDVLPELEDYEFNYEDGQGYAKKAFNTYKYSVVSIRKTPCNYFVLLKGKINFFAYKFIIKSHRVKRYSDMKHIAQKRGRVYDKKEFEKFNRKLILQELK